MIGRRRKIIPPDHPGVQFFDGSGIQADHRHGQCRVIKHEGEVDEEERCIRKSRAVGGCHPHGLRV